METCIKFLVQAWLPNFEDWIDINRHETVEDARESVARRKAHNIEPLKYRILEETITLVIVEECA